MSRVPLRGGRESPPAALVLLAGLVVGLHAGCGEDPAHRIEISVSPTPAAVGPAGILVVLTDSTGAPVPGAEGVVRLRPESGDGPRNGRDGTELRESGPGRYGATVRFPREGEWVVEATLRGPDGTAVSREKRIRVVAGPG